MATRAPACNAVAAADSPAMPQPTTTTSNASDIFGLVDVDAGPAFASPSRILYMSRPSTPDGDCLRLPSSSSLRFCALLAVSTASFFGTTTTPSSSATTTSPGSTLTPAHTTGMFTAPSVAFTVPLAEIAFDHTGKPISVSGFTSRQPASMTRPITPRATSAVASNSPNMPSVLSARAADHQHVAFLTLLDRDMDHPVVAGLRQHGDRGPADRGAGPDRPHVGLHQAASGRAPRARWRRRAAASVPMALGSARLMLRTTTGFISCFLRTQPSVSATRGNNVW